MLNKTMTKFYIYKDGKLFKETYIVKDAKRYKDKGYKVTHRTKGGTRDRKLLRVDKRKTFNISEEN